MYTNPYEQVQWVHPAHRSMSEGAWRQSWQQMQLSQQWQPWRQHPQVPHSNMQQVNRRPVMLQDYGPNPLVVDIEDAAEDNTNFRLALWTGRHLQVTLMSIPVRQDIGVERHPNVDQFIRIEDGDGLVQMGTSRERLDFQRKVEDGDAIMIPAGTWHNVINVGDDPLKLYSIYAPPNHPRGTVHRTKAEAMAEEAVTP